jgi:hypothetical protein
LTVKEAQAAPFPVALLAPLEKHQKDSVTRFSTYGFFHESVSPKPLSIPLGPFQIFSKILTDIRSSRCTTGVVDTGGKWKNLLKNF